MEITDLTGYTWVGNDTFSVMPNGVSFSYAGGPLYTYYLNFNSNSANFTSIIFADDDYTGASQPKRGINYDNTYAWCSSRFSTYQNGWQNTAYKTIQITGGTDATNSTLIAWLEANGTLTAPQPSSLVSVTYNSQEIISATGDATYTLSTNGKYMNSNVVITATDLTGRALTATYGGETILSTSTNGTYTLSTNGKYMTSNIVITIATAIPDDAIQDANDNYIVDVNDDYITTTEISGYNVSMVSGANHWPSGYGFYMPCSTKLKINTTPTSENDYDTYVDTNGTLNGLASASNVSKVFIWSSGNTCGITIGNTTYTNHLQPYSNALEVQITGDSTITMYGAD